MPNSFFVLGLVYRIGFGILSGYVTARLASISPSNILWHY
ncbi:hypothetical protein LEP1GSC188_1893 [Leptospira weilii serovar Topaz str. LT2116]|uniref:Uncharacterized protein n=1 Tax=Leptospira weilii serovar Topaz str. LT2116 TaxID=1088540 RepID=M3GT38_9LEPT|nr:hypothetical protein LEP1GSC188_1893 [Leptospira weilii serovar Topaz str. LT2116]